MAIEVRDRHLAGKQKRHRTGEEADEEQQAAYDRLSDALETQLAALVYEGF